MLVDFLLSRQRIARYLFDSFRQPANLKKVLQARPRFTVRCTGAEPTTGVLNSAFFQHVLAAVTKHNTLSNEASEFLELGVIYDALCSQRVYIDQTAVDDALVDLIYQPSSAAQLNAKLIAP